jgi:hypothetical protein
MKDARRMGEWSGDRGWVDELYRVAPKFAEGLARVGDVVHAEGALPAWAKALFVAAVGAVKLNPAITERYLGRALDGGLTPAQARDAAITILISRGDPDPDWLVAADTWAGLAGSVGVPVDHLEATVERFNRHAAAATDPDFRRGEYAYDLFVGDGSAPHPTLHPLDTPPFFAVEILPGCLGTKGGARTDSDGRVQHADGRGVLRGLYAAGNAAASPFGYGYPGAGGHDRACALFWNAGRGRRGE